MAPWSWRTFVVFPVIRNMFFVQKRVLLVRENGKSANRM